MLIKRIYVFSSYSQRYAVKKRPNSRRNSKVNPPRKCAIHNFVPTLKRVK